MDGYWRPIGTVQGGLERDQRVQVLRHLPQQEVAVAPDADEPVGAQQQMPVEALDRLAELDLRGRLALGGEPAPRVVELVEGEADDLAALGNFIGHAGESNGEMPGKGERGRALPPSLAVHQQFTRRASPAVLSRSSEGRARRSSRRLSPA